MSEPEVGTSLRHRFELDPLVRAVSTAAAYFLSCALAVHPAAAQQIGGRVLDVTSDEPIEGALLTFVGLDSTMLAAAVSDSTGQFLIHVPAGSSGRLRAQGLGYATTVSVPLAFGESDDLRLEIRLRPRPIPVEGVTAVAARDLNRNLRGFLRRRRNGFGRYLGPAEITRAHPSTTSDLLWPLSGRLVPSPVGSGGGVQARVPGGKSYCSPAVYVDGNLINDQDMEGFNEPARVDANVPPQAVRAVEVYHRPYQAPAEFQSPFMTDCPIIVIWTDFGFGGQNLPTGQ